MHNTSILNSFLKLFFLFAILMLVGCFGTKKSAGNSGKHLFETFFVGNEGTQYFIKPLTFNDGDNSLKIDVTFRYKDSIKDSATVNMSFINQEKLQSIDSLTISNDSVVVTYKDFEFLFTDRIKKKINSRFSTKGNLKEITKLFENNNWEISVYRKKEMVKYYIPSSTRKKINKLNYEIFMLF